MILRSHYLQAITDQFAVHPACAILGPRQCGKTTLAQQWSRGTAEPVHRFDLENPQDLAALQEPLRTLERLTGLVIIDEIQRVPELFPVLRFLIDTGQARYLILGSASQDLIRQSSETLAGRIGYVELPPFRLDEAPDMNRLLTRGGFPRSYLTLSAQGSRLWREAYIRTFLERDIAALGFRVPPQALRRFWMMLAHVHGQLLNMNMLATSLGISGHTVRHYLDILEGTFMVRTLSPWLENIGKRQIKTPKIYFRDSGVLLSLLGVASEEDLLCHPYRGAVWEGFALEQVILSLGLRGEEAFFWRTGSGAELDMLVFRGGSRFGFEFKFSDAPKTTKSMHVALADLGLAHLYVIYPGQRDYPLTAQITAVGLGSRAWRIP